MPTFLAARRSADELEVDLTGEWRAASLGAIGAQLDALDLAGVRSVVIGTSGLTSLDLSATWRLRGFLERSRAAGARVAFRSAPPDQLRLVEEALSGEPAASLPPEPSPAVSTIDESVQAFGRHLLRRWHDTLAGLAFLGRLTTRLLRALVSVRRMRPTSIARHVYDTGVTAIPIVALIAFLITVIIAYISAQQLQAFGAEIFVVDLITIGVLRELGVLLTAIIVAGRSGSAFAAEIGAMRLNEEVDALHATGVDPHEVLIVPRVIGLVIALPLLTVIADAIGLTGGALLCQWLLDMPIAQYLMRVDDAIAPTTFWVGVVKAPVFAIVIALVGTYRGMQVRASSRELGRLTTVAVVESIFLVILADALFAVLFMELDI